MANTYSQIYIHAIFAVGHRQALLSLNWSDQLYRYITAACENRGHHVLAINGTENHIHMLIGLSPKESLSSLIQSIKIQSSYWINTTFMRGTFQWQTGYGAFSYSRSQTPAVINYINQQREHHKKKTFKEELEEIFGKSGLNYEPAYMMIDV